MKFLDLFRRKANNIADHIFPNGERDIERDLDRVNSILAGQLPLHECRDVLYKAKGLILVADNKAWRHVRPTLERQLQDKATPEQIYAIYIYLAGEANYLDTVARTYSKSSDANRRQRELARALLIYSEACDTNQIPGSFGRFGLEATNPVPTVSVHESIDYLRLLRHQGVSIEFERAGSLSSKIGSAPIDAYAIFRDGFTLAQVYLCPYHRVTSTLAPHGFTLEYSSSEHPLPSEWAEQPNLRSSSDPVAVLSNQEPKLQGILAQIDGPVADQYAAGLLLATAAALGVLSTDRHDAERLSDLMLKDWLNLLASRYAQTSQNLQYRDLSDKLRESYETYSDLVFRSLDMSDREAASKAAVHLAWEVFSRASGRARPEREGGVMALVASAADILACVLEVLRAAKANPAAGKTR
jgi:hypothetical protein